MKINEPLFAVVGPDREILINPNGSLLLGKDARLVKSEYVLRHAVTERRKNPAEVKSVVILLASDPRLRLKPPVKQDVPLKNGNGERYKNCPLCANDLGTQD